MTSRCGALRRGFQRRAASRKSKLPSSGVIQKPVSSPVERALRSGAEEDERSFLVDALQGFGVQRLACGQVGAHVGGGDEAHQLGVIEARGSSSRGSPSPVTRPEGIELAGVTNHGDVEVAGPP